MHTWNIYGFENISDPHLQNMKSLHIFALQLTVGHGFNVDIIVLRFD